MKQLVIVVDFEDSVDVDNLVASALAISLDNAKVSINYDSAGGDIVDNAVSTVE